MQIDMATSSSNQPEEPFMCPICLDVFSEPVTIPCGHNFCKSCIQRYWDSNNICECPMCKEIVSTRPELRINKFISEMAAEYRKSVQDKSASPYKQCDKFKSVLCDVCTEPLNHKALKSCLVCLTSYCKTHLEPHQRVAALKRHKLIDPVENLEDRLCKKHERQLELFCQTDQTCVCVICIKTEHKTHDTFPIEEEYASRRAILWDMIAEVQNITNKRYHKITELKSCAGLSRGKLDKDIIESVELFTALISSVEKSQNELIKNIKEMQNQTEKQTDFFVAELEQEISDLKGRSTDLEQMSCIEDHFQLLQSFPSLAVTTPTTKDWSTITVQSDLCLQTVRTAVSKLQEILCKGMEDLTEIELKQMKEYAVDLTLDPDTAHQSLILSQDGKEVSDGDTQHDVPDNPKRFDLVPEVLAKEGFSTGRFYYEVQVEGNNTWAVGVARESISRKMNTLLRPGNGFWTICLRKGLKYKALAEDSVQLYLHLKPCKVGVFVNYDEGLVSFYDVQARCHIYSFTDCTFGEKLYPYFSPEFYHGVNNTAPLIIIPCKV